jgi:hypothetical protein
VRARPVLAGVAIGAIVAFTIAIAYTDNSTAFGAASPGARSPMTASMMPAMTQQMCDRLPPALRDVCRTMHDRMLADVTSVRGGMMSSGWMGGAMHRGATSSMPLAMPSMDPGPMTPRRAISPQSGPMMGGGPMMDGGPMMGGSTP